MLCVVKGCRFPFSHVVSSHICGKCNMKGHGQNECGNSIKIEELNKDKTTIPFNLLCCVKNCKDNNLHTTEGHKCEYCNNFGHDDSECPIKKWNNKIKNGTTFGQSKELYLEKKNLQLQARKQMGYNEHKVYTKMFGDLGSTWYARRNNIFNKIELFFMHYDNWGQYGPDTDNKPLLNAFISGYTCIDKE